MKCPHCQREIAPTAAERRVLIIHPSDATAALIGDIAAATGAECERAHTGQEAKWLLTRGDYGVAIVDVAIDDPYAFELVPELKKIAGLYVVLLASVYDKTAYKRRPTSLYGADDYLEQHHLPDKLPVLLAQRAHVPPPKALDAEELMAKRQELRRAAAEELAGPITTQFSIDGEQARQTLAEATPEQLSQRARALARKLVLDISLYNAEEFALGVRRRDLHKRVATPIADAKRFLAERLPAPLTQKDAVAFIDEAIDDLQEGRK